MPIKLRVLPVSSIVCTFSYIRFFSWFVIQTCLSNKIGWSRGIVLERKHLFQISNNRFLVITKVTWKCLYQTKERMFCFLVAGCNSAFWSSRWQQRFLCTSWLLLGELFPRFFWPHCQRHSLTKLTKIS